MNRVSRMAKKLMVVGAMGAAIGVRGVDVPEELTKPGMNAETAAAIQAFSTNPCPATVEMIRASVASNYDAVVARKIAKLHELDGSSGEGTAARDQSVVQEMQDIVDDMVEYKDYRVEQNVVRFTDSRFGRTHDGGYKYNEPDADGFIPLLGAADDVYVAYTPVTNAAYARFDPTHIFPAGEEGHPVVNVTYEDATNYCAWLTVHSPNYAYKYRLPTQEEWELAAGHMPKDASINAGSVESGTTDVYYYYSVYTNETVSLSGALDMWGNVWEWLATTGDEGAMKVKGGAFDSGRDDCRTEERGNSRPAMGRYANVGFRLLRTENKAAQVIQNTAAAKWLQKNLGRTFTTDEYAALEVDTDGDGAADWEEFIAMSDPNDAESRFAATITFDEADTPQIGITTAELASRTYKTYGKVALDDSVWIEVKDNAALYRFFKVTCDLNN